MFSPCSQSSSFILWWSVSLEQSGMSLISLMMTLMMISTMTTVTSARTSNIRVYKIFHFHPRYRSLNKHGKIFYVHPQRMVSKYYVKFYDFLLWANIKIDITFVVIFIYLDYVPLNMLRYRRSQDSEIETGKLNKINFKTNLMWTF